LFSVIYYLLSGNTEVLQSGEHCFQFSVILPNNVPSSFEGQYGHVRYTVKATLDRPWKFDHEVKAAFTVLSHLDLNLDPQNKVSPEFNGISVNVWTVSNT
jgi:hypothetical protein